MQADGEGDSRRVQIKIREATADDLDGVASLWKMLLELHRQYSDHFTMKRDARKRWRKYLEEKFDEISTKLIVAEENDELVGFMLCLISPQEPVYADRNVGLISDVYVRREWRNRGVTKEMLRVALKWYRKNRLRTVELSVAASNLEGRAAWGQLGFKPFIVRKRLDMEKPQAQILINGRTPKKVVRKRKKGDGKGE